MSLTTGERLRVQRFRAEGMSWPAIGKAMAMNWPMLRSAVDYDYGERRRQIMRQSKVRRRTQKAQEHKNPTISALKNIPAGRAMYVPAEVIEERERRLAMEPHDMTAAFCGDPSPGRREYVARLATNSERYERQEYND